MPIASLQSPSLRLKDTYLSLVNEYLEAGERLVPFPLAFPHHDFPAFLDRMKNCALGLEAVNGWVPHETFWLVDSEDQVVGVSNLRHRLSDALRKEGGHIGYGIRPSARRRGFATLILKETLARARALGISRALVTCDKSNVGSARAILKNGGVFGSEELLPAHKEATQRYWIDLG